MSVDCFTGFGCDEVSSLKDKNEKLKGLLLEVLEMAPMTSRCMTQVFSDAQAELRLKYRARWGRLMERCGETVGDV